MNEQTPTPITTVDTIARILDKLCIFALSGDGGVGKTGVMNTLSDHFQAKDVPVVRIDCDSEKTKQGSFASFHSDAIKADIRDERGADVFIDAVTESEARIVLADLGANLERHSLAWFEGMYEEMASEGIHFLAVATITNSAGSVEALLRQARVLKDRVRYLVVKNEREYRHPNDLDYFAYFEKSEQGKNFLELARPSILHLPHRTSDIQQELVNRNLTLYQALHAPGTKNLGPVLSKYSTRVRMRQYYRYVATQVTAINEELQP